MERSADNLIKWDIFSRLVVVYIRLRFATWRIYMRLGRLLHCESVSSVNWWMELRVEVMCALFRDEFSIEVWEYPPNPRHPRSISS